MKTFKDLVAEHATSIEEIMPWDLEKRLADNPKPLLLDIREPEEFNAMHIKHSINVPRGILEPACDYNYSETLPDLAKAREKEIVVLCRSGNRSVLATATLQQMGFSKVASLKTGLRGWNDFEKILVDTDGKKIDADTAEIFLSPEIKPEQLSSN